MPPWDLSSAPEPDYQSEKKIFRGFTCETLGPVGEETLGPSSHNFFTHHEASLVRLGLPMRGAREDEGTVCENSSVDLWLVYFHIGRTPTINIFE